MVDIKNWYDKEYLMMKCIFVLFTIILFILLLLNGQSPTTEKLYNQMIGGMAVSFTFVIMRWFYNKLIKKDGY